MTVLRSGSATDVGRVRTVNEDLALETLTLFAVADGMGGHVGGEIAARTAIDTLEAEFARKPSAEGLAGAIHEANRAVWERSRADVDLRGMGTTMIAAALVATDEGDRLVLANVGDSRAYRLHDHELVQLTTDHSVAEELVARGELSEAEAAVHPHRHILTRALGIQSDVAVDVWEVVPEEGDRFLLCSDGLTNEVPPRQITEVLSTRRDPNEAARILVDMANKAGGNDNVTVVVLDVMVGEHASSEAEAEGAQGAAAAVAAGSGLWSGDTTAAPAGPAGSPAPGSTMVVSAPEAPSVPPPAPAPARSNGAGPAVVSRSAPDTDLASRAGPRHEQHPGVRGPRRITFRVLLFLVVLAGLAYAGYATVRWYVNSSYFVGLNHNQVVIYQGRPGGFVGIKPKIVNRTQMTSAQVPSYRIPDLRSGVQEPSYAAAKLYVTDLQQSVCSLQQPPAYCSTSTTTTTPGGSTSSTSLPTSTPATFGLPDPGRTPGDSGPGGT